MTTSRREGIAFQFTGSIDLSPDEEPDKDPTSTGNAFCPDDYKNRWVHVAESDQVRFIGWNSRTTVDMAGKNDGTCNRKIASIPGTSQDSNWCVPQGLGNLNPVLGSSDHAIALVHLGTNDLNQDVPWSESKPAFVSILKKLRDKTPAQGKMTVLLATILPGDGDNDLDTTGVKNFNRNLQGLCTGTIPADQNKDEDLFLKCGGGEVPTGAGFEVYLINMNTDFEKYTDDKNPGDFQMDNIHTNLDGEDEMAQRWFDAIKKVVDGDNGGVETGKITVKKVVEDIGKGVGPVSEFTFEMTGQSGFSLSDGDDKDFPSLNTGQYTITETPVPAGYVASVSCDSGESDDSSVTVNLAKDEEIVCTFTNTYDPPDEFGTITVRKAAVAEPPANDWQFTMTGQAPFTLAAAGNDEKVFSNIPVGDYTIAETAVAGYSQSVVCSSGETGGGSVTVNLAKDEDIICTFTNVFRDKGQITVVKEIVNGGPVSEFDFTFDTHPFQLGDGDSERFDDLDPGVYTITEHPEDEYAVSIACTGDAYDVNGLSVEVTLNDAEHVTCTFTNEYTGVPGTDKEDVPEADGESIAYTTSNTESNRNSNFRYADHVSLFAQSFGTAIKGAISPAGDVDFFKLTINDPGNLETDGGIIFDVDADNGGSDLDAELCVYDENRSLIGCNDDADGLDPMFYLPNCSQADTYYAAVRGYDGNSRGDYVLAITAEPVLLSAQSGGRVDGLEFGAEDILARTSIADPVQYKWTRFFDASDMGITRNIVAFDMVNSCPGHDAGLAVTFTGKQQITDSTGRTWKSTPHDVVAIDVTQFGPATEGEFGPDLILEGSQVGLTTRGERIDAITNVGSELVVSTLGQARVRVAGGGSINVRDEDLILPRLIGGLPAWTLWFDGSEEVPGLSPENLYAASYDNYFDRPEERLIFVIKGKGRVAGYPVTQRNLCFFDGTSTTCDTRPLVPFNIDALD